jgi:2-succinyl-5-enolpyruvyl-6-hydroxy-3-cyclohexene-1-carboxylate synthase
MMNEIKAGNFAFRQCFAFLKALQDHGLQHVIISPGSRSTPLVLAAASLPQLQKKVILDERSAGFIALGIGKATLKPAALICTSGTAVANYFPAVIEAHKSGVPMLLLTADRPADLQYTGANQAINQQEIFGKYPVFFHDMGNMLNADEDEGSPQQLAELFIRAAGERQGPVHLNFPFRKPLEPTEDYLESIREEFEESDKNHTSGFHKNGEKGFQQNIISLQHISDARRPLIIIGQLAAQTELEPIFRLAKRLKAPVLSEQGIMDCHVAVQGFEGFLRRKDNRVNLEPDLILRFGREPASSSLLKAVKNWHPRQHIYFMDTGERSDIEGTTTDYIDLNRILYDLSEITQKSYRWLNYWKKIEEHYFENLNRQIAAEPCLTDGHIYHHLAPAIPEEWNISISNSFPARDRSMFGRWGNQKVFTNRGASGIDGITSTAIGVTIGSENPCILFIGDLAFLHGANGLLDHKKVSQSLIVVIINNRGGSIFRMLPVSDYQEYFETYFETPQHADLSKIAGSYGVAVKKVETVASLKQLKLGKIAAESRQKLCVIECKTDPQASMQLREKLWNTKYEIGD